jgi:ligand-binding SRPBCC domain-containing protein
LGKKIAPRARRAASKSIAMLHFEFSSRIEAPVEVVFAFHESDGALEKLIPPGQNVQVESRSGGIQVGAIVVLKLNGLIRWHARHTRYERNRMFEDVQDSGPFSHWRHQHLFEPQGDATVLRDRIEFSLPLGFVADPLFGWLAKRELRKMFEFRHRVTKAECERIAAGTRA